jgi:hypothetical protein
MQFMIFLWLNKIVKLAKCTHFILGFDLNECPKNTVSAVGINKLPKVLSAASW